MRPTRPTGLLSISLLLACCVSNASAQDALLDDAQAKLKRQDAVGAYALLAPAEMKRAGDPRFDYLLGVAAIDAGQVTRAIFALERVVEREPDNMLARAELGRAYLAAGDAAAAREQFRLARSGELPEAAAAAIERVLSVVDQVAPDAATRFSAYLELGGAYDSNVNSATNQGEFAIPGFGGIVFETTPENRQRHDLVLMAAGGASVEKPLSSSWKLLAAANLRATVDRVVHDMNTVFADASFGVRHTAGAQSQVVALQNGTAWVGSRLYRTANGLSAQWQSQFAQNAQVSAFAQWSHQAYKGQSERDTDRSLLGLGSAREFSNAGLLVYGSTYAAHERAQADFAHFGHRAVGLRLGLEHRFSATLTGFLEAQYERRRYGGTEPFFDVARRDHQRDANAGFRWRVNSSWQLTAQARATQAASNVVLYDYTRNVLQIAAQRSFP